MTWTVWIHPLVSEEDFRGLDRAVQQRVTKAIRKKLTVDPEGYGEPLRGEFKGYWKMRVGDHRVVYSIKKDQVIVHVLKVGIRRDFEVYEEFARRLRRVEGR